MRKGLTIETMDFINSMKVLRDSIKHVEHGDAHFIPLLCVQLRYLILEKNRNARKLLLHLCKTFNTSTEIYCNQSTVSLFEENFDKTDIDENVIFSAGSLPATTDKNLSNQRLCDLETFLHEKSISFQEHRVSYAELVTYISNNLGGAHHSKKIDNIYHSIMGLGATGLNFIASMVVQVSRLVFDIGLKLLNEICEYEIVLNFGVVDFDLNNTCLFDFDYINTKMKISLFINKDRNLCLRKTDLHGRSVVIRVDRYFDWTERCFLSVSNACSSQLKNSIQIRRNGVTIYENSQIDFIFTSSNVRDYHTYFNRFSEEKSKNQSLFLGTFLMMGRQMSAIERANITLYMNEHIQSDGVVLGKGAYGDSKRGETNMTMHGDCRFEKGTAA